MKHRIIKIIATLGIFLLGSLMTYAIIAGTITHQKPITTSIAVEKPTLTREVKEITTDNYGFLLITYSDGTVQNAGRVKGNDGEGQYPTSAQLSAALLEYCRNGKCDAKQPTQAMIISALEAYCAGGMCKGADGKNAVPITADQISTAVANYCSDGRCKGAVGASGLNGDTTVLSCVTRTTNTVKSNYIAWKYTLEPDTSYRDLYKLPVWAEAQNCKVL